MFKHFVAVRAVNYLPVFGGVSSTLNGWFKSQDLNENNSVNKGTREN